MCRCTLRQLTCNCACSCSYVRVISITGMQSRLNTINVTCSCMLHSPAKCDRSLTRRAEMGCNWAGSMIVEAAARIVGKSNMRDSRDACDSDVIQTCVSVLLPKIYVHDPGTNAGTIAHIPQSSYTSPSGLHQLSSQAPQPTCGIHRSSRQAIPQQQQLLARHRQRHCAISSSLHACCSVTSGGWEQVPVEAA
jgi:hypothetical protein